MTQSELSELEINIKFPTCWDGVNIESASGDHVMYAPKCDGEENDECFDFACPSSHPVKMPEIHLYVRVLGYEVECFSESNDPSALTHRIIAKPCPQTLSPKTP